MLKGEYTTLDCRHDANESVNRQLRYRQITEILTQYPQLTAREIAVRMKLKGFTPTDERNFSAPRLDEMCKSGLVEPVGKKKCEYTGKTVTVFALRGG